MDVFRALDRNGNEVVLLKDLDRALGAAGAVGDEQHGVAAFARAAQIGDPVAGATAELDCRLTGDVTNSSGVGVLTDVFYRQLFETASGRDSGGYGLPGRKSPVRRWRSHVTASAGVFVAVLELLPNLQDQLLDLFALGHEDARAMRE